MPCCLNSKNIHAVHVHRTSELLAYNTNISKRASDYVAFQHLTASYFNIEPWTHPATAANACLVISSSAVATSLDKEWVELNIMNMQSCSWNVPNIYVWKGEE